MGSRQKKIGYANEQKPEAFKTVKKYPIQTHDIIIPLPSIEFDCKAAWITSRVREFPTKGDGGKANKDGRLVASLLQEIGLTVLCLISNDAMRGTLYLDHRSNLRTSNDSCPWCTQSIQMPRSRTDAPCLIRVSAIS